MKYKVRLFIISSMLFVLISNIALSAMNTGFSTKLLSNEEKNSIISNINLSLVEEEPTKTAIECFDVNKDAMIAICQSGFDDEKIVAVYTYAGEFQYGYSLDSSENIGVEWDENNLNIYFVRSDVIVSVNSNGEILDISQAENTVENNTYLRKVIFSKKRITGDVEYDIRNEMGILNIFASSYSQLVATNSAGEETVLYDVSSEQITRTLTGGILFVIVFLIIGIIALHSAKQKKEKGL